MRREVAIVLAAVLGGTVAAQPISIDRAAYLDRLHGMWLGEVIANWTGLQTEGYRIQAPFLTDADWGTILPGSTHPLDFITNQDPWQADDNTDVEYVYLHLMSQRARQDLTPTEIVAGWQRHMNPAYIWVSNLEAYSLMNRGVFPPMTGAPVCNGYAFQIDAQLTTEFFGALAPAMPGEALAHADLPIRTTAGGFAAHAAQYYIVLHALTPLVDPGLSPRDQVLWLARTARQWIPSTSKTADVVDFVLADFASNPDPNDWERTRDRVFDRYQLHAGENGFIYREWTESSVNFAAGVIALMYGHGDYRRTLQIGTLGGWDSDDQTATMGAIIGMLIGYEALRAQFPGQTISDRYHIGTRLNLPDYLPGDPQAEDTLLLMSERMLPLIDQAVVQAGGSVAPDHWLVPPPPETNQSSFNPMVTAQARSANWTVRAQNGIVTCHATRGGAPPSPPWVYGVGDPSHFGNAYEVDAAGRDGDQQASYFYSSQGGGGVEGEVQTLTVEYSVPVQADTVRFIEGDHQPGVGGWFRSAQVQVKSGGVWQRIGGRPSAPVGGRPFQIIDWALPQPALITGVRITGPAAGGFVTCCELDALVTPTPHRPRVLGPGR